MANQAQETNPPPNPSPARHGAPHANGPKASAAGSNRRGFFARVAAVAIGALITVFPLAAGLFVFADPLRRGAAGRGFIKVTNLESVPDDDVPRAFPVVASCIDAWTCFPSEPIGAVFVRRKQGPAKLEVFQTTCPHAGCMLDYSASGNDFKCPCHNSAFHLDGQLDYGPSPRPMDSLAYEIRDNHGLKEVWVKFETFHTGIAEKIAKS
ncbi:MAG TPA: Rieske 2Fe-2S domain-containing protein [Pirellulales bacterium]|jgi:Rieske Fe-S protein|nr:Rieske 2Fe-2S domain-containing protein [Pirellulales bacterium]